MVVGSEATGSIGGVFVSSVYFFVSWRGRRPDGRCPVGGFCRGAVTEEVRAPGRESFNGWIFRMPSMILGAAGVAAQAVRSAERSHVLLSDAGAPHLGQEPQVSTM